MSPRVHYLDVDLLGGLLQLRRAEGRVGVRLPAAATHAGDSDGGAALRDLLQREAEAYHRLEREVATRRQAFFAGRAQSDEEGPGNTWFMDAAAAAGRDAAAHAEALRSLDERLDDVVAHCVVLAPGADRGDFEVTVQLHDDGYALAQSREAALLARREYLGLSDGDDWATPASEEESSSK